MGARVVDLGEVFWKRSPKPSGGDYTFAEQASSPSPPRLQASLRVQQGHCDNSAWTEDNTLSNLTATGSSLYQHPPRSRTKLLLEMLLLSPGYCVALSRLQQGHLGAKPQEILKRC